MPFYKTLTLILLLLVVTPSHAVFPHDPSLSWQTLESENFLIHYHDQEQIIAQKLVRIAEQQHRRLSQILDWQPQDKTHIVLTDRYDFSNGWATPFPTNHMTMINRPPSDLNSLEDYHDWLELLFIHEYIHILQLDMATAAPGVFRKIFGRFPLLFPHLFQPSWVLEGLATHFETDMEQGIGRGQGALYRGIMALEVKHGLLPLTQLNGATSDWPAGATPYLYGVYFYQFLIGKFGEEKVMAWLKQYSRQLVPFLVNTNLKRIFDQDMASLYLEFEGYLQQRFANDIAARGEPSAASVSITDSGYQSGYAQLMDNGDLYFISDSQYRRSQLNLLPRNSTEPVVVSEIYGDQFDADPDLGILITQYEISDNSNIFNEIYLLTPGKHSPKAITQQGRYQYAVWDKSRQQILAVHYQLGRFALHRLSREGELLDEIWQGESDTVVGSISLSKDSSQLVASIKQPGGSWELALLNLQHSDWQPLTHNNHSELHPRFSPDGGSLLFTADYSGYYEIYQLNLDNQQLNQLTQGFGASNPSINVTGDQLYYRKLSENGWDLHRSAPLTIKAALPQIKQPPPLATQIPPNEVEHHTSTYQAYRHILPSWWFPYLSADRNLLLVGISTSGSDPLYRHQYLLNLGFDNVTTEPNGYLTYRYDRWRTGLQLTGQRSNSYYFDNNDEVFATRSSDELILSSETPLLYRDSQWALHGGVVFERDSTTHLEQGYSFSKSQQSNSLAGIGLSYNNSRSYRRSISMIDGRSLNLVAEKNRISGGDFTGYVRRFEWREYLRLGDNSVAALRYQRGQGETNTPTFELGGTGSSPITRPGIGLTLPPFNQFEFPLRGYRKGIADLTGQSMQLVSAELRLPLTRIEKTVMAPPVGVQQLHGALFYDVGSAWNEGESQQRKRGVGIELHSELLLGYRLPVTLTLGAAKGIDEGGENQYYLRLGGQF